MDTCSDVSPCQNGASCIDIQISPGYLCQCLTGYYGYNCSTLNQCLLPANPCQNGASCSNSLNNYTCSCLPGYSGRNCSVYDACSLTPCGDNGVCTDTLISPNYYSCNCNFGWTGSQCNYSYPTTQQGLKLVGSGRVGSSRQGTSVAISKDGTTLVVGAPNDNSFVGSIWIFINNGTQFIQYRNKFTGDASPDGMGNTVAISANGNTIVTGGLGGSPNNINTAIWIFVKNSTNGWFKQGPTLRFGYNIPICSIALSSLDGNTLAIGMCGDSGQGTTTILVRDQLTGNWTQQGSKLIGTPSYSAAQQGQALSLSADGNTLAIGAPGDISPYDPNLSPDDGSVWIFVRDPLSGNWTQEEKLDAIGIDYNINVPEFGSSVSLSGDGNIVAIGAPQGNWITDSQGQTFIFTRNSTGLWNQFKSFLFGTGCIATFDGCLEGSHVSLNSDGNILAIGGDVLFSGTIGAVWIFIFNGTDWVQAESKLSPMNYTGASVSMSTGLSLSDNGILAAGGPYDNSQIGATWIFVGPTMDTCEDLSPCSNTTTCINTQISPSYVCQ